MENKANKNPQSNLNPTAQSSSQTNTSTIGSASQSSVSGTSGNQSSAKSTSGSQSGSTGKSVLGNTFSKENLNNLSNKLQEFGSSTVDKVNKLSTTQKVVGGSLLALGAGWVAMNSINKSKAGMGSKSAPAQDKLNKNLKKNR